MSIVSHRPVAAALAVGLLLSTAATAQTVNPTPQAGAQDPQQCQSLWATLDGNRDGVLTQAELQAAQEQVPQQLRGRERITESDFMETCAQPNPAPKR
jgi:hypothetical protein